MEKSEKIINAYVTSVMESQDDDKERYFLIIWTIKHNEKLEKTAEVFKTRESRDIYWELHFNGPEARDEEMAKKDDVKGDQLTRRLTKMHYPQFH